MLTWGLRSGHKPAANFCRRLLKVQKAFWTFARIDRVEPTNNHAERMLRPAVLWRKNSFGCQSPGGCRFVERLLTAVQTRRLQGKNVLQFLCQPSLEGLNGYGNRRSVRILLATAQTAKKSIVTAAVEAAARQPVVGETALNLRRPPTLRLGEGGQEQDTVTRLLFTALRSSNRLTDLP